MRLARLRTQMLIAMGLPACWASSAPAPVAEPPKPPVEETVTDGTCRADTLPETICGTTSEHGNAAACGTTAEALKSFGESALHVTNLNERGDVMRHFKLNDVATAAYRGKLKVAPAALPSYCCYSRCTPLHASKTIALVVPDDHHIETTCIPSPPGGTRVPDAKNAACPAAIRLSNGQRTYATGSAIECCYAVPVKNPEREYIIRGRAARVDGEPRFASVGAGERWSVSVAPNVDVPDREALAAKWLEAARMEHASIASFANLSLRLLAHGAPPELVAGAHAAALDEIEHAQVSFAIASAYAGAPLAPLAFADVARMTATGSLADLARETFVDGCINETAAAYEAEVGASAAEDPVIADVLAKIAADETRHAQLAWAIVAWCARRDRTILDELHVDERDDIARDVIAPCLAALRATSAAPLRA
jgi:hypothetical protein